MSVTQDRLHYSLPSFVDVVRQLSQASSSKQTVSFRPLAVARSWLSRIPIHLYGTRMATRSTTAERVEALVRRMDGTPLCDECIADRLDLSSVAQAGTATQAAGGARGFELLKAPCGLCGEPRQVIRSVCGTPGSCRCRVERGSIGRALAPARGARGRAMFWPRSALGSPSLPGGGWPPSPRARRPAAGSPRARFLWALRAILWRLGRFGRLNRSILSVRAG